MRKLLLTAGFILLTGILNAQEVVYFEDFQGQAIPPECTVINNDGQVPNEGLMSGNGAGWDVGVHRGIDPDDYFAYASSAYGNGIQADDWLILPKITMPVRPVLFYEIRSSAIDAARWEKYEILVSTSGKDIAKDFTKVFAETAPFSDADNMTVWSKRHLDLTAYAGQDVHIAFRCTGTNGFLLFLDDIKLQNALAWRDLAVRDILLPKYRGRVVIELPIELANNGSEAVDSCRIGYELMGTGQTSVDFVPNLNLAAYESKTVTFKKPLALTTDGVKLLRVWVEMPNGQPDQNPDDNEYSEYVVIMDEGAPKRVLIEKYTGTWCGHCPKGTVVLSRVLYQYPDAISVNVHNSDVMTFAECDSVTMHFASGYPSASFDRFRFDGDNRAGYSYSKGWDVRTAHRMQTPTPLSISLSGGIVEATEAVDVTVTVNLANDTRGDYLINVYLVEEVASGGSEYDQRNYANNDAAWPELNGLGDPIANYKHKNVVRAMPLGPWGEKHALPESMSAGEVYKHNVYFQIPDGLSTDDLKVVAYVADSYNDRTDFEILNAAEMPLDFITSVERPSQPDGFAITSVFPQPAQDNLTIQWKSAGGSETRVAIFDLLGKVVHEGNAGTASGYTTLDIQELPAGVYILRLTNAGRSVQKVITIAR